MKVRSYLKSRFLWPATRSCRTRPSLRQLDQVLLKSTFSGSDSRQPKKLRIWWSPSRARSTHGASERSEVQGLPSAGFTFIERSLFRRLFGGFRSTIRFLAATLFACHLWSGEKGANSGCQMLDRNFFDQKWLPGSCRRRPTRKEHQLYPYQPLSGLQYWRDEEDDLTFAFNMSH